MGGRGSSSGKGKSAKGGGSTNNKIGGKLTNNANKILNVLDGQRGMVAVDTDGEPVYATNKTSTNGALKISSGRWRTADRLIFTTGKRDANGAVSPSLKYSEAFADSSAKTMTSVYDNISYSISKNSDFRPDAFKRFAGNAHKQAQQQLKRKSNIIDNAVKNGKMSAEEAKKQRRKANKEYANDLNSFYKEKSNQRRYGFSVSHT